MKCLHCGKKENLYYCENCIQELITENAKLQLRIKELEEMLEYKPKHMKEESLDFLMDKDWVDKHIPKIEYINGD